MEFEKLNVKTERSWLKRIFASPQIRKSGIYIFIGALVGFAFFFFSEGVFMDKMAMSDIRQSIVIGALAGLFISNSPCSGGRC